VIWGKFLFVTTATDAGRLRSVVCLDAESGAIKWIRNIAFQTNPKHAKNSFASATPATDGKQVYVAFADENRFQLYAYDFEGNLVWEKMLGAFKSQHGQGASPILFEDLVIMANDQDGPSTIVAFNRQNGEQVWSVSRPSREASYSTPIIIQSEKGKPQLICLSGATGVTSLDPKSGETNWSTSQLPARTVASPTYAAGLIYAICGQGGKGVRLIGVDPTGSGDVSETHVKFVKEKEIPYVPAVVGTDETVFFWTDAGLVTAIDPKTGGARWQKRVGGNFSGSPILLDGKLYCIEESGKVIVLSGGSEYQLLGENPIGDPSYSTPAVANGRLYLRSFHRISALKSKE
jgi:outer membrane protein assembly factor BamB